MRKQYKSSKIKNKKKIQKKKKKKKKLIGVPLKGYVASLNYFLDLAPEMKNSIVGISSD